MEEVCFGEVEGIGNTQLATGNKQLLVFCFEIEKGGREHPPFSFFE